MIETSIKMSKPPQPDPSGSLLPTTTISDCDTKMPRKVIFATKESHSEQEIKTFRIMRKPPKNLLIRKGEMVKPFRPPQTGSSIYTHKDHRLWCTIHFADFTYHGTDKIQAATFDCSKGAVDLRTMDNIINLIGIDKYKVLIQALLSITDEDLRKKSIAALLTPQRGIPEVTPEHSKTYRDAASMTNEDGMDMFSNSQKHKCKGQRSRQRQRPYVIAKEAEVIKIRKTVIDPFACLAKINEKLWKGESKSSIPSVPDQLDSNSQIDLDNFSDYSNRISKAASLESLEITPSIINDNESLAHKLAKRFTRTDPDEEESSMGTLTIDDSDIIERQEKREPFDKKSPNMNVSIQVNSSVMQGQKRHNSSPNDFEQIKRSHQDASLSVSETSGDIVALNSVPSSIGLEGLGESHGLGRLNSFDSVSNWDGILNTGQKKGIQREDWFHLNTPERIKMLSPDEVKKRVRLQMYIDLKLCLEADDDDKLPIHNAVLTNDIDLLKRQCLLLKAQNQSIDIGDANLNLSALQMCVVHGANLELARELLRRGASPLAPDDEERSALHYAAEAASHDYVLLLLEHMAAERREILKAENLWSPDMDDLKPTQLVDQLFWHALTALDINGYTPLMLAAQRGHPEHVYYMLERIVDGGSEIVNFQAPNSGNTALYLAVEAACHLAEKVGNTSQIADKYSKVIENLIRYGADPWIENNYGANTNTLVIEYRIQHLNTVMNNAMSQVKLGDVGDYVLNDAEGSEKKSSQAPPSKQPFIIIKTEDGLFYEQNKKFGTSYSKRNKKFPSRLKVDSLPSSFQDQLNNSLIKTKSELTKADVNIKTESKIKHDYTLLGLTGEKCVGSPKTTESPSPAKTIPKVSLTIDTQKKPVILQDIKMKNASDYVKNFQIKPIKVKVLPKNTITAGTSKVPLVNDNTNALKKPGNLIKIARSNLIVSGTQNLKQTFANSFGQNITLVKGTNQSPVYKLTGSINDRKIPAINIGRNLISKSSASMNDKEIPCNSTDNKLKLSVAQDVSYPKAKINRQQVVIAPISNKISLLKPQSSSNDMCKATDVPDQNTV